MFARRAFNLHLGVGIELLLVNHCHARTLIKPLRTLNLDRHLRFMPALGTSCLLVRHNDNASTFRTEFHRLVSEERSF